MYLSSKERTWLGKHLGIFNVKLIMGAMVNDDLAQGANVWQQEKKA